MPKFGGYFKSWGIRTPLNPSVSAPLHESIKNRLALYQIRVQLGYLWTVIGAKKKEMKIQTAADLGLAAAPAAAQALLLFTALPRCLQCCCRQNMRMKKAICSSVVGMLAVMATFAQSGAHIEYKVSSDTVFILIERVKNLLGVVTKLCQNKKKLLETVLSPARE